MQQALYADAKERYDDLMSNLDYIFSVCHPAASDVEHRKNLIAADIYLQAVMFMAVAEDRLDPEEVEFIEDIGDYGSLIAHVGEKPVRANMKQYLKTAGKIVGAPPQVFMEVSAIPREQYRGLDVCALISDALTYIVTCCCKIDGSASKKELDMSSRLLAPLFGIMRYKK